MVNDHLSDLITRIRNGYMAHKESVEMPKTNAILRVAEVLKKEGYLAEVTQKEGVMLMNLKYNGKNPAIMGINRVSKPGARVYCGMKDLPKVWGGLGKSILSTPKGVMSDREARKLKVGGEIIAQVW